MTGSTHSCRHSPHTNYALYSCGSCKRFVLKSQKLDDYFVMAAGESHSCSECSEERCLALRQVYTRQRQRRQRGDNDDGETRSKIRRALTTDSESDEDSEAVLLAAWTAEDTQGAPPLQRQQHSPVASTCSIASTRVFEPRSPSQSPERGFSQAAPKYIPLSQEWGSPSTSQSPQRVASPSAAVVDSAIRCSLASRRLFPTPGSVRARLAARPTFPQAPRPGLLPLPTDQVGCSRQSEVL